MGELLILNGSPRAPRSNSRQYALLFAKSYPQAVETFAVGQCRPWELCRAMEDCSDLLLVFPLYADGLPSPLMGFLQELEKDPPHNRPVISILINCGFLEPEQNDTAIRILRRFCQKNGYPLGSILKIGGGEAILSTPFRFLAKREIRQLAKSIHRRSYGTFQVTMPLSKQMFLRASCRYWENCGKRNGLTKEQMSAPQIENESPPPQ